MATASCIVFVTRYFWPELIGAAPFACGGRELSRRGRNFVDYAKPVIPEELMSRVDALVADR